MAAAMSRQKRRSIMSSFALLWTLLGEVHDLSRENSFHASRTHMHYAGLTYHARPVPSRRERLRSRRGLISCAPSGRRGLGGLDARPLRLTLQRTQPMLAERASLTRTSGPAPRG